ncbi:MAG: DUF547 domain-containing protein [Saprospirales bacterium]|nr:DUF547 domain-containing protein [Saprospirales bacterium]
MPVHLTLFRPSLLFGGLLLVACSGQPSPPAPPAAASPGRSPAAATPAATPPPPPGLAAAAVDRPEKPAAALPAPPAPAAVQASPAAPDAPGAILHDGWDQLLRRHVRADGKVNYAGFKTDRAALSAYLQALARQPPAGSWSRAEQMAYWINAYNAFTVDLIAGNYPVSSILNLDGGKTWDVKRIELGGKKYSLNEIENDILRSRFQDARIHFVLNCAAVSCPPLLNRAYTAETLSATLDQRTRQFIQDPKYNILTAEQARVSKIFEWYAADFGDLRQFLYKYAAVKPGADTPVFFLEYDWKLNGLD